MLSRALVRALVLLCALFFMFGCAGSSGCAGMEPIPGGFPLDQRVENGMQVRLTPDGVTFMEDNIDEILAAAVGGSLAFEIPPTTQDVGMGITARICPDGGCYVTLNIVGVNLVPTSPDYIQLHLDVQTWTSDAAGTPTPMPLEIDAIWTTDCTTMIDTRPDAMAVTGRIVFTIDAETGYTSIEFQELNVPTEGFEAYIGIEGGAVCWIVDLLKGLFIDSLMGGINDMLTGSLGDFTCMSCEVPSDCPSDATCDGGTCMRGTECVATLLGMEGRMDMGSLLASFSPGVSAEVDLVIAAGGYADVDDHGEGGISLGMFGGAEPVELAQCVPHDVPVPPLGPVPISDEIHSAVECPGCTPSEVHMVLGASETVLNRIGWAFHQSGGLCLGVGADTLPITSGTLGMLITSLGTVTWDRDAPVAMELVPALPPTFEIGAGTADDPLLIVNMPSLSIDFYVWAHDRWVRFMRMNSDISIPLELEAVAGEIQINVAGLNLANTEVTDTNLLTDDPVGIAVSLEGLIGTIAGPMLGNVGSVALPDFSGFTLNIPDGGLGHVEQGDEEFLAIYASLGIAPATALLPDVMTGLETEAEIVELDLPPTEEFAAPPTVPRITLALDAPTAGDEEVEFRTRLNTGFWSRWSTDRTVVIEDGILTIQGRHRLYAQARLHRQPATADPDPVEIEVLIDTLAPEVTIIEDGRQILEIESWDMISPTEAIAIEWRPMGEESWRPVEEGLIAPPENSEEIEIRATDEAGNVSVSRHELRGRIPDTGEGCGGCATTRSRAGGVPVALGLVLFVGLLIWRRRRGAGLLIALLATASLTACSGTDPIRDTGPDGDADADADGDATTLECENDEDCVGGRCCIADQQCIPFTTAEDTCAEGTSCSEIPPLNDECQYEACSACSESPPLDVGFVGLHSSIAVLPDGSAWIAGYAAGTRPGRPYGDLAVAQVSSGDDIVPEEAWTAIDGIPSDVAPSGDIHGFRGGISEPGDDVGMYTSIAANGSGDVGIAYYDADNRSLRYIHNTGGTWEAPAIVDGEAPDIDAGRFADLAFVEGDVPAIVYMSIEVGDAGAVTTRARYALANDTSGSSWRAPLDLDMIDDTPCTAMACELAGMDCDLTTGLCENETSDCTDCASDLMCVRGDCHEKDSTPGTVPEGTGVWPDLAVGEGNTLGVIFYDRTAGELVGTAFSGDSWSPPQVLAGADGDVGWSPSLAIDDDGIWHMSVVDGVAEDLLYLTSEGVNEVIDGRSLGEHHNIRGDDSSIVVLPNGNIRVAYQDATDLQLWMAERDGSGLWTTTLLDGQGLADTATQGFYVNQTLTGSSSLVSAWYFDPQSSDANGVVLFWM